MFDLPRRASTRHRRKPPAPGLALRPKGCLVRSIAKSRFSRQAPLWRRPRESPAARCRCAVDRRIVPEIGGMVHVETPQLVRIVLPHLRRAERLFNPRIAQVLDIVESDAVVGVGGDSIRPDQGPGAIRRILVVFGAAQRLPGGQFHGNARLDEAIDVDVEPGLDAGGVAPNVTKISRGFWFVLSTEKN